MGSLAVFKVTKNPVLPSRCFHILIVCMNKDDSSPPKPHASSHKGGRRHVEQADSPQEVNHSNTSCHAPSFVTYSCGHAEWQRRLEGEFLAGHLHSQLPRGGGVLTKGKRNTWIPVAYFLTRMASFCPL